MLVKVEEVLFILGTYFIFSSLFELHNGEECISHQDRHSLGFLVVFGSIFIEIVSKVLLNSLQGPTSFFFRKISVIEICYETSQY